MKNNSLRNFLFLFIVSAFIYLSILGINLPYVGPNAANFNNYSLIAKNYNQFGFLNTKFAEIISVSNKLPSNPSYYVNHQPLLTIIEATFLSVFGYGFWVGRLTVIIFSLGSLFLIYSIAKKLIGEKYALISSFVYLFMPASTIFGKMIGQEPLVLFFSLLTVLMVLKYFDNKSKFYTFLIIIAVLLGSLSDWAMTYFSLLISVYLFCKKEKRLAIIVFIASLVMGLLYLAYIYNITSGLSEMIWALQVRSIGTLFEQSWWPLRWFSVIIVRFILYFNPLFVGLGFYYLFKNIRFGFGDKKEREFYHLLLVLFGFGLIHVLLYPDGSFGHPYWMYYFIPFVTFSSAFMIGKIFKNHKYLTATIVIFSILFIIPIQHWKLEQIKSNVWRYSLAQKADKSFYSYEPIQINLSSAIDRELLKYVFSHEIKIIGNKSEFDGKYKHFLYSCMSKCSDSDDLFVFLLNNYSNTYFFNAGGEAYVFDLRTRTVASPGTNSLSNSIKAPDVEVKKNSWTRNMYIMIKNFLNAPQI
jgi:4-amino-4-deoxy-L-arabinose transferase-like glycosyltransferase